MSELYVQVFREHFPKDEMLFDNYIKAIRHINNNPIELVLFYKGDIIPHVSFSETKLEHIKGSSRYAAVCDRVILKWDISDTSYKLLKDRNYEKFH